ncbi:hypothetical protein FVP74_08445 [Microbacterium saccharophilum]|uniref:DUF2231 domain-containing protein n=1 Tax=Microbacterium saccharophilum TaxID=1213358 RepID=A0A5C8HXW6_9MICO|nr:DUF2231 domain-containing protein [Microbacterium saccharophilum]TXK11357.1 hypothetical protein FVP74_08445 [Microbacterium saccharophilum]GEP48815.1 hypothetical protein MSA03_23230 [Microbacterium saccharophilum]
MNLPQTALEVSGLPLHPLVVHAVVILVPLTALALVLGALWPAARTRLGLVTPIAALVVLVLVPVTVLAGESLKETVGPLPTVERHEGFGRMLMPWAIALFVVAAGQWVWHRRPRARFAESARTAARAIDIALIVLAVVAAVGSAVVVVLAGESGSRAVWGSLG